MTHPAKKRPSAEDLLRSRFIRQAPTGETPILEIISRHRRWKSAQAEVDEGRDDVDDSVFNSVDPDDAWIFETIRASILPKHVELPDVLVKDDEDVNTSTIIKSQGTKMEGHLGVPVTEIDPNTESSSVLSLAEEDELSADDFLDVYAFDDREPEFSGTIKASKTNNRNVSIDWPTVKEAFKEMPPGTEGQKAEQVVDVSHLTPKLQDLKRTETRNSSIDWRSMQEALDSIEKRSSLQPLKTLSTIVEVSTSGKPLSSTLKGGQKDSINVNRIQSLSPERPVHFSSGQVAEARQEIPIFTDDSSHTPSALPPTHHLGRRRMGRRRRKSDTGTSKSVSSQRPSSYVGSRSTGLPRPMAATQLALSEAEIQKEFEYRKTECLKLIESLIRHVSAI